MDAGHFEGYRLEVEDGEVVGDEWSTITRTETKERSSTTELWLALAGGGERQFIVPSRLALRMSHQVRVFVASKRRRQYVFMVENRTTGQRTEPVYIGFDRIDLVPFMILVGLTALPVLVVLSVVFMFVVHSPGGILIGVSATAAFYMALSNWRHGRARAKNARAIDQCERALERANRT